MLSQVCMTFGVLMIAAAFVLAIGQTNQFSR